MGTTIQLVAYIVIEKVYIVIQADCTSGTPNDEIRILNMGQTIWSCI